MVDRIFDTFDRPNQDSLEDAPSTSGHVWTSAGGGSSTLGVRDNGAEYFNPVGSDILIPVIDDSTLANHVIIDEADEALVSVGLPVQVLDDMGEIRGVNSNSLQITSIQAGDPGTLLVFFNPGIESNPQTGDTFRVGTRATYYLDEGGSDFSDIQVEMALRTTGNPFVITAGVSLRFRRVDEDNYWEFTTGALLGDSYRLNKTVGGVTTTVASPGTQSAPSDRLRVEAFGPLINCYVNQTLMISVRDEDLLTGSDTGISFPPAYSDLLVDQFIAVQLEDLPITPNDFYANYQVFVDWDNDGGLSLGDFESPTALDEWAAIGYAPPDLSTTTSFYKSGSRSLFVQWRDVTPFTFGVAGLGFGEGTFGDDDTMVGPNEPMITRTISNLIVGREYTLDAWVYVPSGSSPVEMSIDGIAGSVESTLNDEWELLRIVYTAEETQHTILIVPVDDAPLAGGGFFLDEVMNLGGYEEITDWVLGVRQSLDFFYGRDYARALSAITPGDIAMTLDNQNQVFTPDNPGSPLFGFVAPGKPMLVRATYNDHTVNLFHGFIDDYQLNPNPGQWDVSITCMDTLQYLANAKVSTELYPSIQTGEAVHVLLDSIGWPQGKRDIDPGASTVRWWCEEGVTGFDALGNLVEAEGPPAIAYVDAFNNLVFRSRHHRFIRSESNVIQTSLHCDSDGDDATPEPNFSPPMTYEIGWKDIINTIDVDVEVRTPQNVQEIWKTDETLVIHQAEPFLLNISTSDPFYDLQVPSLEEEDFHLVSGSVLFQIEGRTSGKTATIRITSVTGSSTIEGLRIRGNPVPVNHTRKVLDVDNSSVEAYGPKSSPGSFEWANVNDMTAIGQIILGQRAERLPVVHITLNNGHPIRISNILNRSLSDRIRIVEPEHTFTDDDFFIEVLQHSIQNAGQYHTLTIGCEKARNQTLPDDEERPPSFTFNDANAGFDDGYFEAGQGFTFSDQLFILGMSRINVEGLGY